MSRTTSARPARYKSAPRQLIIAKGDEVRVVQLRGWMMALGVVVMLATTCWLVGATAYVLFRDDVLAAMMARQTRMQHAYEDRIAALRLQIDRVTSRQLIDQEAFAARMEELMRRQATLDGRAQVVQGVLDRARQQGVVPAAPASAPPATPTPPQRGATLDVPRDATLVTGSLAPVDRAAPPRADRIRLTLDGVETSLGRMVEEQEIAIAKVEVQALEQQTRIRQVVQGLGVNPDRIAGPRPQQLAAPAPARAQPGGVGGPLLPLPGNSALMEALEARAANLTEQLGYLDRLRRGLSTLPVRRPVRGEPDISSGFGPRRDPFLGVMAFHSGMDFRAATGDPIHAAAAGIVTASGRSGGYGLTIDIDHGNGLSTRYAHLSHLGVREGQRVTAGQLIGRAGSTGRSTGPHLHYETRINDEAVNPDRFMRAGQRLGMW